MKFSLPKYLILVVLPTLFIVSACTGNGSLSRLPQNDADAIIANLLSQSDRYVIHYHGNSEQFVSGILFDPKKDAKSIRPEGLLWKEISDDEAIASIVDTIQTGNHPNYFPNLYSITGPNNDFYGYIITGWMYLVIRPVDGQTLRVYGLKGPPEYEDVYPGG